MNAQEQRRRIMAEAFRLLRPSGRHGIHELNIVPDTMPPTQREEICARLSSVLHI